MDVGEWQRLCASGCAVPTDRPLDDVTTELVTMLGSPDPTVRVDIAHRVLTTWIARGVYDDLMPGLGDGMTAGLLPGLGEHHSPSVFRRSWSAAVLTACVLRDNETSLVPGRRVLDWGDRVAGWLVRERDLRGHVAGQGWAHAIAHGADALAALASSDHLAAPELTVLLDVVADRLDRREGVLLVAGEPDRLAAAVVAVLRREVVPLPVVTAWIRRLQAVATPTPDIPNPYGATGNAQATLRALYVQLTLAEEPVADRHDLTLAVAEALRETNAPYLRRG